MCTDVAWFDRKVLVTARMFTEEEGRRWGRRGRGAGGMRRTEKARVLDGQHL